MESRREFFKKLLLLAGAAGASALPPSIQKAFAIEPDPQSTYLDAEHIVLLMQENRSFDHTFGTLRGVRGFNDPRAFVLPNKNKIWLQTNAKGETYTPFRLDIKDTKITWMGSLPHSRKSQTGARNNGRHDNWLEAKKSGNKAYADMPLTMGYYTREDIPFYYALADAFTVCDQNFCSSLTPTDPNRLHFWSGTIRAEAHDEDSRALIDNGDVAKGVGWRTFPELLETNNVSWKIYQNEIGIDGGFTDEEDSWLANYGDNTLELFTQYNVRLAKRHIDYLPAKIVKLQNSIRELETKVQSLTPGSKELKAAQKQLKEKQAALESTKEEQTKWTTEKFNNLSPFQKSIHQKAFSVNSGDPDQHRLTPLQYMDSGVQREINIPKGDILHQFREDVRSGKLPTVSWLVPPQNFSDHPSAPWFGSWYLSEVMDILTQNPEVWKKTIFILTYDENDGYFDHVPPFTPPDSRNPASGKASAGIDTRADYVRLEKDLPGPIGLGFRVPMIIASPWTRGGWVNSQVFDHTSTLQFLESFLNKKFAKNIEETNITNWRRTVCGNLTSVFRPFTEERKTGLPFIKRAPFIEGVHKAKFKNVPSNYRNLSAVEIAQINTNPQTSPYMPQQEKGLRPACSLPYELYADGNFNNDKKTFEIILEAKKEIFKEVSVGSPFIIYSRNYLNQDFAEKNYAVAAGDHLNDIWTTEDFKDGIYDLRVYGPNGFFRQFRGNNEDPHLNVFLQYQRNGNLLVKLINTGSQSYSVEITDNAYTSFKPRQLDMRSGHEAVTLDLDKSFGWYDFSIKTKDNPIFEKTYAGRVETGKASQSDPAMS